jgi:hypothetical protein
LNKKDTNLLEVKVYDIGGFGGIYEGPVGLIFKDDFLKLHRKEEKGTDDFWDNFFRELFGWD